MNDQNSSINKEIKIVGLVPARNEANNIAQCLKALSLYTDAIVYLDDVSVDNSLEIVESLINECNIEKIIKKTEWFKDEQGDRNKLLQAGREIGGTHFIVIDADEMLTSNFLENNLLRDTLMKLKVGERIRTPWITPWRNINQYIALSWSVLEFAFCDDGKCSYSSSYNHSPRVPRNLIGHHIMIGETDIQGDYTFGLLHFNIIDWNNLMIRSAWSKCLERTKEPEKSITEINATYNNEIYNNKNNLILPMKDNWLEYDFFDGSVYFLPNKFKKEQVEEWLSAYGREYFSGLDIWDIDWNDNIQIKDSEEDLEEYASFNTLVGPLNRDPNYENILMSYEILGDYSASPEVMTFTKMDLTNKDMVDTTFNYAVNNLPVYWQPDYTIFWGIDNEIIPDNFEKSESTLIGVVFNWNLAFESLIKNIGRFDWIFTDKKGEKILKEAGFNNVSSIRLRAYSSYLHRKMANEKKSIDIIFIGDLTPDIHGDREKYLYRLAMLSKKYNVKIYDNVFGDEYVKLINQSKIVFNICSNQRVNQRCFEATACNSLLFVEEDNLEIRDYFTDKESCVLYNSDNFEELVDYYLKNDLERQKITDEGYKKAQEYTFENVFENLTKKIKSLKINNSIKNRSFNNQDELFKHKAKAKQALQSSVSGKFFFIERELDEAMKKSKVLDSEVLNNLGVINSNAFFV
ncbi:MAG: glycosyltransferase, partial [Candidatus Sericytochromatia bacterium]|nr:glycosyltransferase [Candidatus Sericytochromatia bacterium]